MIILKVLRILIFLWLGCLIFWPSAAMSMSDEGGQKLEAPVLEVTRHTAWRVEDVFEGGRISIENAPIYAFILSARKRNIVIKQLAISVFLNRIAPRWNISDLTLRIDEDNDGVIGPYETKTVGGQGQFAALSKDNIVILFPKAIALAKDEELKLILTADIFGVRFYAEINVWLQAELIRLRSSEGRTLDGKKGLPLLKPPKVRHFLKSPLVLPMLKIAENESIDGQFIFEGYIYHRRLIEINLEKLADTTSLKGWDIERNTAIEWRVERVVTGERVGISRYKRFVSFILRLPKNAKPGRYTISSFRIFFADKAKKEIEEYVETEDLAVEKVDLIIKAGCFPGAVSLGEDIVYNITLKGKDVKVVDSFIDNFDRAIGDFFQLKSQEVHSKKHKDYNEIHFTAILIFLDHVAPQDPGRMIPEIEFLFRQGDNSEIKSHVLPAVKIKINSRRGFEKPLPKAIDSDAYEEWWFLDYAQAATYVFLGLAVALGGYCPIRYFATRTLKASQPLFAKKRAKRAFEKARAEFAKTKLNEAQGRITPMLESLKKYLSLEKEVLIENPKWTEILDMAFGFKEDPTEDARWKLLKAISSLL